MVRILWIGWAARRWGWEQCDRNQYSYKGAVFCGPLTVDLWGERRGFLR